MNYFRQFLLGLSLIACMCGLSAFGESIDGFKAAYVDNESMDSREIIEFGTPQTKSGAIDGFVESRYPQTIAEHETIEGGAWIVELWSPTLAGLANELRKRGLESNSFKPAVHHDDLDELITLVDSGPSANRIDLVFMGDGYTANERQKFIDDMNRLVDDMFRGATFSSYLPLFNVYAVFRPSNESGIGKNDRPKDTAYRLYRAGNTLRAIYPGDRSAIRASCRTAPGCDYPIVIANDPYYGGLGGEVAISTSSKTSGTVVLRHELGHNFGRVGEEYDGGGYFGANHTSSATNPSWKHWVNGKSKEQASVARYIDWPWHNLEGGEFTASWRSSGQFESYSIHYSASGVPSADSMSIELNGRDLNFRGTGSIDRDFIQIKNESEGFTSGNHTLVVKRGTTGSNRWFSNIAVHEYGSDYVFDRHHVSAYPMFSKGLKKEGYRPTHETCLMRNMTSTEFCQVCQENNWMEFFKRMDPIDDVETTIGTGGDVSFVLKAIDFPAKSNRPIAGASLAIEWYKNGKQLPALDNQKSFTLAGNEAKGSWEVKVALTTAEVRRDPRNSMRDSKTFSVK